MASTFSNKEHACPLFMDHYFAAVTAISRGPFRSASLATTSKCVSIMLSNLTYAGNPGAARDGIYDRLNARAHTTLVQTPSALT